MTTERKQEAQSLINSNDEWSVSSSRETEQKTEPLRFTIKWDKERGGYYVSRASYDGGEVVDAAAYDAMKAENERNKVRIEEILGYAAEGVKKLREALELSATEREQLRAEVAALTEAATVARAKAGNNYSLKELVRAANVAVEEAKKQQSAFGSDPINWGSLSCVSAEYVEDNTGNRAYRVQIEEASHDCARLQVFVSDQLAAAGFKDIGVETEW